MHYAQALRRACSGWVAPAIVILGSLASAQGWVKGSYLSNAQADCPPFVFVAMPLSATGFGTDVRDQFALGSPGRQLMFMARQRAQPVVLFPRAVHKSRGLVNSPSLGDGSVHEPTVYHDSVHDQYWTIVAYANDLANRDLTRPCELYAINVTAAVRNPATFDPDSLPVSRLTESPTTASAVFAKAFNPTWASQAFWSYGIKSHFATNSGPCVVDQEQGPTLYFASNERRAGGFGLMAGELAFTPTSARLLATREIQHFGTTSLITFFETPGGCAGAYQSSVESPGQWGLFEFHSDEAAWTTATGYGNGSNVSDHNGTTIAVGVDPADSEIAVTRYYLNNNESFGSIMLVPYAKLGLNTDDGKKAINQVGMRNLFPGISPTADDPSWVGKFGMPGGGRRGTNPANVELFLTYSPTCSNERVQPCAAPYHATLVAVTDISSGIAPRTGQWGPQNASSYSNPAFDDSVGVYGVLKHPGIHAFWMRPLLTQPQRFGWKHRRRSPLLGPAKFVLPHHPALKDMPVAKVTAGPIYNTDVRSMASRLGGSYDPTTEVRNANNTHHLSMRVSCLTKDVSPSSLTAQDVWGVRVFATDPDVQRHYYAGNVRRIHRNSGWGYLHHSGGVNQGSDGDAVEFERTRLLSDVPAAPDGSVSFLVPANIPVRLSLLHKDGSILAAHRAHHSFAPGQVENRCTGCHQHGEGKGVDPRNLAAFQPSYRPFNTLTDTGKLDWNASGQTVFTTHANTPSLPVPEFKKDIWPLLKSDCRSCHDSSFDPNGDGLAKFDLSMPIAQAVPKANPALVDRETAIWSWLHNQRYINRYVNGAKSPLAWYFSGVADDTTVRLDGETNARYRSRTGSKYWITTRFAPPSPRATYNPHAGVADKRHAYKVIEWIDAGAAIDHDNGGSQPTNGGGVNYDGYQIALSARLVDPWTAPRDLVVGFWDVDNNVTRITVTARGHVQNFTHPTGFPNGSQRVRLPAGLGFADRVTVEAVDANDNHTRTEKSVKQLWLEAETHRGDVRLSVNGPVFRGGERIEFSIDADASCAGRTFVVLGSFGIYPGTPMASLPFGIYDLPNFDALTAATVGLVGSLDGAGNGTIRLPLPAGLPPVSDIHCVAIVVKTALAKSNVVDIKFE